MALKARDKKHLAQILAGTTGRLRGHDFESALSTAITDSWDSIIKSPSTTGGHLFEGEPEKLLLSYILDRRNLSGITKVVSHWLGGLATSGKGDLIEGVNGETVKRSKSDILLEISHSSGVEKVGASIKTCNKDKPTNAQLFCSTASAFCALLKRNEIPISNDFEAGFRMFCGDEGFRPRDDRSVNLKKRQSDPDRWFYEELPEKTRREIQQVFADYQDDITRALLRFAYSEDPFPPEFVFHQMKKATSAKKFPVAIFDIEELIELSKNYSSFKLKEYRIRKGRFKNDPNTHSAPRFGCIQFQRLGNKQNATQLQFNLEAGYFNKITAIE